MSKDDKEVLPVERKLDGDAIVIVFGGPKGGGGKSTLATNAAVYCANRAYKTAIVDGDLFVATSSAFADTRFELKINPSIAGFQKQNSKYLHGLISSLLNDYDIIIVDTKGEDGVALRTALPLADIIVSPFKASQPDINILPKYTDIILEALDQNPELTSLAVLNEVPYNSKQRAHVNDCREVFEDFSDAFTLMKSEIVIRTVYSKAVSVGRGVLEMDNSTAISEFSQFMEEVFSYLEVQN